MGVVLDIHVRDVKIKNFVDPDVVTVHLLQKGFMEKCLCWFSYETIVDRMVGSTSSSNNVHGVVNDNSNPYRNMIIDMMRMNQGYIGECLIIDEESYVYTTKFFNLLKDSNELL